MGLNPDFLPGQTPLDEDEINGLLIPTITTHYELDEFEQQNIEQAILWTIRRTFKQSQILSEAFVKKLHQQMYGEVWAWAGEFRKTEKNIGIEHWKIGTELKYLLDDANYWIENNTYLPDELAIRFKHRLVSIHCFPNGNGRHSRLMADILIEHVFKRPVFTWGAADLLQENLRKRYLEAVKTGDKGELIPLLIFARS